MNATATINVDRIEEMMARKGWGPGELAANSGVSYDTIYKIRMSQRPRTSAAILAMLAQALDCSLDYLANLTDDPTPAAHLALTPELRRLHGLYHVLSSTRRHELLLIAEALVTAQNTHTPEEDQLLDRLMAFLLERVEAVGGERELDRLLDELEASLPGAGTRLLHRQRQQAE